MPVNPGGFVVTTCLPEQWPPRIAFLKRNLGRANLGRSVVIGGNLCRLNERRARRQQKGPEAAMLDRMPVQHQIAPGWTLFEEDGGAIFLMEDVRNVAGLGAEEVRHGPFKSVLAAREWLASELEAIKAGRDALRRR